MKSVEIWGIEPQTFHMQSERSTTELYPRNVAYGWLKIQYRFTLLFLTTKLAVEELILYSTATGQLPLQCASSTQMLCIRIRSYSSPPPSPLQPPTPNPQPRTSYKAR